MTKTLSKAPSMLALYLKAALKKNKPAYKIADTLPALAVELHTQVINRNKLKKYQSLCGFEKAKTIPASYLQILTFPLQMQLLTEKAMPFAVMGLVHLNNHIEVFKAITSDDGPFTLSAQIGKQQLTPKGLSFEVIAQVKNTDGELLWQAHASFLHRCKTDIEKTHSTTKAPLLSNQQHWNLASNIGRRYGRLSLDINPIHLFAFSAKLFGFKRQIAHGLYLNARCIAALEGQLPPAPYKIETAFKRPLLLPAKVVFYHQRQSPQHLLEVWSEDQQALHLSASITALVHS